jgi:hypothetical protein
MSPRRVLVAGTAVRTAPRASAPSVADAAALPFVWSRRPHGAPPAPAGWVAVTLWRADGSHAVGFVPKPGVRFVG